MHLGEIIESIIKERGMTKAEFGRRIHTSRQNVNTLLRKASLETKTLSKICRVLRYNFFQHIDLPWDLKKQAEENPEPSKGPKMYVILEVSPEDRDFITDYLGNSYRGKKLL